ncbi:MAG TPA: hypothetical protein VGN12_18740 [Pirellulales bacterium]|jgi:hypothetical protein
MSRILALAAALVFVGAGLASAQPGRPLRFVDAQDEKIERELNNNTELEFADTPLSDVVDYIKSKHEIELQLDSKGLADAAVDPAVPITKSLKGISLRSSLHLILDELDLTFAIVDQILLITSKEKAATILSTEVYRVRDIVGNQDKVRRTAQLTDLLTGTVQPKSWDTSGGSGTIKAYRDLLVISQTFAAHEEIHTLLEELQFVLPKDEKADAADADLQATDEDEDEDDDQDATLVIYQLQYLSADEAKQAVTTLVMPNSWQGQGGDGAVFGTTFEAKKEGHSPTGQSDKRLLAVRQTADAHAEIRSLLRKLDKGPFPSIAGVYSGIMPAHPKNDVKQDTPPDGAPAK